MRFGWESTGRVGAARLKVIGEGSKWCGVHTAIEIANNTAIAAFNRLSSEELRITVLCSRQWPDEWDLKLGEACVSTCYEDCCAMVAVRSS